MGFIDRVTLRRFYRFYNGRRYYVATSRSVPGLFLGGHDWKKITADIESCVRFLLKANRKMKWGGKYCVVNIPAPPKRKMP